MTDKQQKELEDYIKIKTAGFIYRYAIKKRTIPRTLTFSQWIEKNNFKLYEAVVR